MRQIAHILKARQAILPWVVLNSRNASQYPVMTGSLFVSALSRQSGHTT